mmetsp:Transcript_4337/g.9816  ORF Transcript_4337/g.9816 Transcript_4337/m.9816 type:complete len:537 (+) Transcript_4337:595-2205(+)
MQSASSRAKLLCRALRANWHVGEQSYTSRGKASQSSGALCRVSLSGALVPVLWPPMAHQHSYMLSASSNVRAATDATVASRFVDDDDDDDDAPGLASALASSEAKLFATMPPPPPLPPSRRRFEGGSPSSTATWALSIRAAFSSTSDATASSKRSASNPDAADDQAKNAGLSCACSRARMSSMGARRAASASAATSSGAPPRRIASAWRRYKYRLPRTAADGMSWHREAASSVFTVPSAAMHSVAAHAASSGVDMSFMLCVDASHVVPSAAVAPTSASTAARARHRQPASVVFASAVAAARSAARAPAAASGVIDARTAATKRLHAASTTTLERAVGGAPSASAARAALSASIAVPVGGDVAYVSTSAWCRTSRDCGDSAATRFGCIASVAAVRHSLADAADGSAGAASASMAIISASFAFSHADASSTHVAAASLFPAMSTIHAARSTRARLDAVEGLSSCCEVAICLRNAPLFSSSASMTNVLNFFGCLCCVAISAKASAPCLGAHDAAAHAASLDAFVVASCTAISSAHKGAC